MEKKTAYYLGYEIDESLYSQIVETINHINTGGKTEKLCEMAAETIIEVTNAGFLAYYDTPTSMTNISPSIKRATDAGVHTVQKAIRMVIKKLLKKRSLEDLRRLAFDLSHLICVPNQGPAKAYACFRLRKPLYEKTLNTMQRVNQDPNLELYREDVISSIEDLIATGIDMFYTKPVEKSEIGKLTRKAADLSMHGVQKGTNSVIHRLFRNMEHQEMKPLANYMETLLHSEVSTYYSHQQAASQ